MKIYIPEVPTVYINLDTFPNRNASMQNMLTRHGFTDFVRCPGYVRKDTDNFDAVSAAHLRAMTMLPSNSPWLILEDDCVDQNYADTIVVPDDADIVYLGAHINGADISRLGTNIVPRYSRVDENTWRVLNMISAHAILYITEFGKRVVQSALDMSLTTGLGADEAMAYVQPLLKVYVPDLPLWYQHGYPELTNCSITDADNLEYLVGGYGGGNDDFPAVLQ